MVDKKWGQKHRCLHCGVLFYDMASDSPICPECGKPHNIEDAIKLKPMRIDKQVQPEVEEEEDIEESSDGTTVLEETDELEGDDSDVTEVIQNSDTKDSEEH